MYIWKLWATAKQHDASPCTVELCPNRQARPGLAGPLQEPPSLSEEAYLALETNNARTSAVDHPGLYKQFFAKLTKFEEAASDIPAVFLIIPDEYQVNDKLWQSK